MTQDPQTPALADHAEPHSESHASLLNGLRAAVLGANDGITSTAGLVIGVAAATTERNPILLAGIAGLAAGAMSMGIGEYVSVSTQRDTEQALLDKERGELAEEPQTELEELTQIYQGKGLSREVAERVADELTAHDALAAHAEVELKLDPEDLTNPWVASIASAVSFTLGALVPLLAILLASVGARIWVTVVSVVIALGITGVVSARLGGAHQGRALLRNVAGGIIGMAVTYAIGRLAGQTL